MDRLDAGLGDVLRCVEIRLARREGNDVLAFGLELGGPGCHGEGGGGLNLLNTLGK